MRHLFLRLRTLLLSKALTFVAVRDSLLSFERCNRLAYVDMSILCYIELLQVIDATCTSAQPDVIILACQTFGANVCVEYSWEP